MCDTVRLNPPAERRAGREVSAVCAAKRTKDAIPEEAYELIFSIVFRSPSDVNAGLINSDTKLSIVSTFVNMIVKRYH